MNRVEGSNEVEVRVTVFEDPPEEAPILQQPGRYGAIEVRNANPDPQTQGVFKHCSKPGALVFGCTAVNSGLVLGSLFTNMLPLSPGAAGALSFGLMGASFTTYICSMVGAFYAGLQARERDLAKARAMEAAATAHLY